MSDEPGGPFEVVEPDARVNGERPGDHSLFVDDDGTAYLVYTDIALGHRIRVEQLNADWTGSTGRQSALFEPRNEATAMFKHGGAYYVTFGNNCAFCPEGAGVQVHRAAAPLGPYEFRDRHQPRRGRQGDRPRPTNPHRRASDENGSTPDVDVRSVGGRGRTA